MAAKLKSVLKRIHWSLVIRALVFAAAWFLLPFWIFLFVGLYLYLIPLFRTRELALPFLLVIFFALQEPVSFWFAPLLAALFYLILGIKDLIFIDRKPVYEALVLLLLFLMFLRFFSRFDHWSNPAAFFYALAMSAVSLFLIRGFLNYEASAGLADDSRIKKAAGVSAEIAALVIWQVSLVLLFLPLNFLYQSALLFLTATVLLECIFDYLNKNLTRQRILTSFSVFFVFLVIILGSVRWGL